MRTLHLGLGIVFGVAMVAMLGSAEPPTPAVPDGDAAFEAEAKRCSQSICATIARPHTEREVGNLIHQLAEIRRRQHPSYAQGNDYVMLAANDPEATMCIVRGTTDKIIAEPGADTGTAGRFQIVIGPLTAKEIFLIDSATGRTWQFCSFDSGQENGWRELRRYGPKALPEQSSSGPRP